MSLDVSASMPRGIQAARRPSPLIGEFVRAGWSVQYEVEPAQVTCNCPESHKTFIRQQGMSDGYANLKLSWLFNETCYVGSD